MKHAAPETFLTAAPLPHRKVMGLPMIDAAARPTIDALLAPGRRKAFFVNAHCINLRARDADYAAALDRADMLLPDGIGVDLAARMTGPRLSANLNGTDLVPDLLIEAARRGMSVFLMGGTPGTADRAAAALVLATPGLRIAGTRDGYAGAARPAEAVAQINASGADIVLVAMGVPRQELWIDSHAAQLRAGLTLGVGALFDFLAGNVRRAPAPVRRARAEWAWRLAMEPRRMARRYLLGNFSFMARAGAHALGQTDGTLAAKRACDIAGASAALVMAAPILLLAMLAIRVTSPGPVFFNQTRIGKDGVPFRVFKLRSMHVDAEARRAALLARSDRAGICFKARNDPRITAVGRILRRFSIDELPQILNVLKGDMALVGPRPALPAEVAAYPQRALARLRVKPGITGIWQVSGRADIGFDKMIDLDLAYARSPSVLLDLVVLAMTVRAVFSGRGAY